MARRRISKRPVAGRPVIVELRYNPRLEAQATSSPRAKLDATALPRVAGVDFDRNFAPVRLNALTTRTRTSDPRDIGPAVALDRAREHATYIVRATATETQIRALRKNKAVIGVWSDARVRPFPTCGGDMVGTDEEVEQLLSVHEMQECGMDGHGVYVAIVDTGVNIAYLKSKGKNPKLVRRS